MRSNRKRERKEQKNRLFVLTCDVRLLEIVFENNGGIHQSRLKVPKKIK